MAYDLKGSKVIYLICTIFLIRSNITPTDNEITVKAEMANIIGGIISPNNHLSIKGIEYQGEVNLLIVFLISD